MSTNDAHLEAFYRGKRCLVTGGASFIGSHLSDALVALGANVVVLDDFSSGSLENLIGIEDAVRVVEGDAGDIGCLKNELRGQELVFHLAAIHGGRGFIDMHPDSVLRNLAIDWALFSEARSQGVFRVVHASSACSYPVQLQSDADSRLLLSEDLAGFDRVGQAFPDGAYGWGKLMGEYQLATFCANGEMTGRSARIFTAYGSRENESHAMVALVAKALLRMDPFPIWGDGLQTRNFTHVSDTVRGLLLLGADSAASSFEAFNVGTETHTSILETLDVIFDYINWTPAQLDRQLDMPVGVKSRASSNQKMRDHFNWEPSLPLLDGVPELVDWYQERRLPGLDRGALQARLLAR